MPQGRLGGLLFTALLAGSILQDAVEAQRSLNKCCPRNEHVIYNTTSGRYDCAKMVRKSASGEGVDADSLVGSTPAPSADAGEDTEFVKFLTALSAAANDSFREDDVVAGVSPDCADADTDWLFAPSFRVRATPTSVTLRPSRRHEFAAHVWCVDLDDEEDLMAVVCPCGGVDKPCVRKCCHRGEAFDLHLGCVETASPSWTPTPKEPSMTYYLLPNKVPTCEHHSIEQFQPGQLTLLADGAIKASDAVFSAGRFCVDANATDADGGELVLFCIEIDALSDAVTVFKGVLAVVGAVALLVTVVLTATFPEMRKSMLEKMALCHNASLFVAFFCIAVTSFSTHTLTSVACKVISFVMQFTLLAAFFWLTAMCLEISCMFRALQRPSKEALPGGKFAWYSVFAWGSTLIISVVTLLVELTPGAKFKPRFGEANCFFYGEDKIPQLLFLFGPMAILIAINLVLFVFTATRIMRRRTEASNTKTSNRNKQNLVLFLKLFTLMGVTWVFEIISWAVGGKNYYWLAIDCINLLRGVFIFVMICCKRSVLKLVRARFGCSGPRGQEQGSAASSLTGASKEGHEMTQAGGPGQ